MFQPAEIALQIS